MRTLPWLELEDIYGDILNLFLLRIASPFLSILMQALTITCLTDLTFMARPQFRTYEEAVGDAGVYDEAWLSVATGLLGSLQGLNVHFKSGEHCCVASVKVKVCFEAPD